MPTYWVTLWFEDSRTFPMEAEDELDAYRRAAAAEWTEAEFGHPEATADSGDWEVGVISCEVDGEEKTWRGSELAERAWPTATV
jgi:hypothetical protein